MCIDTPRDRGLALLQNIHTPYRVYISLLDWSTRNTCMQRRLAYIFKTLFRHEVFVITVCQHWTQARLHVITITPTKQPINQNYTDEAETTNQNYTDEGET